MLRPRAVEHCTDVDSDLRASMPVAHKKIGRLDASDIADTKADPVFGVNRLQKEGENYV